MELSNLQFGKIKTVVFKYVPISWRDDGGIITSTNMAESMKNMTRKVFPAAGFPHISASQLQEPQSQDKSNRTARRGCEIPAIWESPGIVVTGVQTSELLCHHEIADSLDIQGEIIYNVQAGKCFCFYLPTVEISGLQCFKGPFKYVQTVWSGKVTLSCCHWSPLQTSPAGHYNVTPFNNL